MSFTGKHLNPVFYLLKQIKHVPHPYTCSLCPTGGEREVNLRQFQDNMLLVIKTGSYQPVHHSLKDIFFQEEINLAYQSKLIKSTLGCYWNMGKCLDIQLQKLLPTAYLLLLRKHYLFQNRSFAIALELTLPSHALVLSGFNFTLLYFFDTSITGYNLYNCSLKHRLLETITRLIFFNWVWRSKR